jgi:hypothetical protein
LREKHILDDRGRPSYLALGFQGRQRIAQWLIGDHHEVCERLAQLKYKEDRSGRSKEKMQSTATALVLLSAKRLMFARISVSQPIGTIRKGMGIDPPALANSSRRVLPTSVIAFIARD